MKLALLVGTRPEVIKMAPVIRLCQEYGLNFILIHSNQHYSESMDAIFFKELGLPAPDYNLGVGSGTHSNQIGNILIKIEPILAQEKPDVLLTQGDTNTVLSGALAASKMGIKVGHIEAGLRSFDRTMPEEGNRVMTDHLSDYLFAVASRQVDRLLEEGVPGQKIFKVGNTIVDAVYWNKTLASTKSTILETLNLRKKEYTLFTAHRAGNVDTKYALKEILDIVSSIEGDVCWPMHLRTRKSLDTFGLTLPANVVVTEPLGYMDFLNLEANAKLIVTDSGGLQEEACILGVPCITIRENTERPETIDVGANAIVGRDLELFSKSYHHFMNMNEYNWDNPFGDGTSSEQILQVIADDFGVSLKATSRKDESLSIVGMGYMGLPLGCLLAQAGYDVKGYDINSDKVAMINKGETPFDEPGLDALLKSVVTDKYLVADTALSSSATYIVAVPTPHKDQKCDLSYVISACEDIAKVAKDGQLVIIESTIKPNTCKSVVAPIFDQAGLKVEVVHCPERAIPGNTLYELKYNDRIMGGLTLAASERAKSVYKSFVKGEIYTTSATSAECVKLMENTYRDINVAIANDFDEIAAELGVSGEEVIWLANRHPRVNILTPGPGVGGHCLPIDPWFLTEDVETSKLISVARNVNDNRPLYFAKKALHWLKENGKNSVTLLGVAYKKNVDDAREAPAVSMYEFLNANGIKVFYHDPFVSSWHCDGLEFDQALESTDLFVAVTIHDQFSDYDFANKPVLRCSADKLNNSLEI
jgi:UDP-N-acetylglucosamine 2-epimerase (non-hydrolysing)